QSEIPKSNGHDGKFVLDEWHDINTVAESITKAESGADAPILNHETKKSQAPVLGITGTGGAGKSSVTDEIVRRFLSNYSDKTIAVISVDPSRKKTGGALLGDRIRM